MKWGEKWRKQLSRAGPCTDNDKIVEKVRVEVGTR